MKISEIEKVAAVFHAAWSDWTTYFLEGKHTPKDLMSWVSQKTQKYEELPEHVKEKRREWARRTLEVLNDGE